jgi:fructokinase
VNLRKDGYTPSLVLNLMYMADVLKVNEEELELVLEWMVDGDGDRDAALNKGLKDNLNMNDSDTLNVAFDAIGSQFDVEAILLTLGAEGSVLWRRDMGLLSVKATSVEVVDTVGAGDAFLAGVLYGWVNDWEDTEALAFGSKLGAYVAGHRSATPELEIDLL